MNNVQKQGAENTITYHKRMQSDKFLRNALEFTVDAKRYLLDQNANTEQFQEADGCIGAVSEIFDAEHPQTPRRAVAQA